MTRIRRVLLKITEGGLAVVSRHIILGRYTVQYYCIQAQALVGRIYLTLHSSSKRVV